MLTLSLSLKKVQETKIEFGLLGNFELTVICN